MRVEGWGLRGEERAHWDHGSHCDPAAYWGSSRGIPQPRVWLTSPIAHGSCVCFQNAASTRTWTHGAVVRHPSRPHLTCFPSCRGVRVSTKTSFEQRVTCRCDRQIRAWSAPTPFPARPLLPHPLCEGPLPGSQRTCASLDLAAALAPVASQGPRTCCQLSDDRLSKFFFSISFPRDPLFRQLLLTIMDRISPMTGQYVNMHVYMHVARSA